MKNMKSCKSLGKTNQNQTKKPTQKHNLETWDNCMDEAEN